MWFHKISELYPDVHFVSDDDVYIKEAKSHHGGLYYCFTQSNSRNYLDIIMVVVYSRFIPPYFNLKKIDTC